MTLAESNLLLTGVAAVTVALLGLCGMVHFELGPAARLAGHKRWLLAAALGSGVLAFMLKLIVIVVILAYSDDIMSVSGPIKVKASTSHPITPPPRYLWTPLTTSAPATAAVPSSTSVAYEWQALPESAPEPRDNPSTPLKVELGRELFFDPSLSFDGSVSCASCHDPYRKAGTDQRPTSRGIRGQTGQRNAPTVWNAAFQAVQFWDGRASSLEEQAKGPMLNPVEMGMPSVTAVEERVRRKPRYILAFARAFGSETITFERIAQAIAVYERTLLTPDTPYDRFVRGDLQALQPAQLRGMALFQSVGCINCHYGPNFSAASVFGKRMPYRLFPATPTPYEQRYDLVRDTGAAPSGNGRGLWRVPSLRNVALTGPWLHNGSVDDLKEVVRIMASAQTGLSGQQLRWSDQTRVLSVINRPRLSEQEVSDIAAFLHALSSEALMRQGAALQQ